MYKEFDKIYEILKKSFPKELYRSFEGQRALLDDKDYHIIESREDGEIVGFLSYWEIEKEVYFVEHLAVLPDKRGKGIGKDLLGKFLELKGLKILEVEPPHTEIDKKRIALYESFGFIFLEDEYYQPPYNKGDSPTRLHIMSSKNIDDNFKTLVDKIHKKVYS